MERYFTKTFRRFLIAFLCIIAAAFGVMVAAGYLQSTKANSVDNYAGGQ